MKEVKSVAMAMIPVALGVAVGMVIYGEINKQIAAKNA